MEYVRERLGQILLGAGVISDEQLSVALEIQRETGKPLGRVLQELGMISEELLARTLAVQKGLKLINLLDYDVNIKAATLIPEKLARKHNVLPVGFSDSHLVLAMSDPLDVNAMDDVTVITGYAVEPIVTTESDIVAAINQYLVSERSVKEAVAKATEDVKRPEAIEEKPSAVAEEVPIVKLTNRIILQAVTQGATDIHFEPGADKIKVRYRVDGVLKEVMDLPKRIQQAVASRFKIMSDIDITEKRIPQDGRTGMNVAGRDVDFRVATLPTIHGENVILRILGKGSQLLTLEQIGMDEEMLGRFRGSYRRPHGSILATGPTGCGKTSTLYATLNELNVPQRKIITVEEPVEYEMPGIAQVPVNVRAGLSFAAGLRAILRCDPDIVMVGEVRDLETAQIAIRAALTGHLVLSTLHTNDAAGALTRLTDMGVEPFLITSSVAVVVAQRLARRLCEFCKEQYSLSEVYPAAGQEDITAYREKGCRKCLGTGYKGRVGLFEVMIMTDKIGRACLDRQSSEEIAGIAASQGMRTMFDDGLEKVKRGTTSIEEVMRVLA